jgi:catechol 2,3-dioxygenase-like lactoylglutathione lyase family enzyme
MEERLRNIRNVDLDALHDPEIDALKSKQPPADMPFKIGKMGHAVLMVQDIDASVDFYTQLLGFKVSDVYPDSMIKGRMVFMRFNDDHHGIGLVGQATDESRHEELHHMAFEVSTIDEVFRARDYLEKNGVQVDFDGRRRAGCQMSVEFRDPDGHRIEIFWAMDQVAWNGEARPPEEWAPKLALEEAVDDAPPGQDTTLTDSGLRRA